MKEAELQQYIWDNRDRWQELLLPLELEEIDDDDYSNHFEGGVFEEDGRIITIEPDISFSEPDPGQIFLSLIQRRIKKYYEYVKDLYFLGKEIRLEKNSESTIRADFLAYSSGRTGFAVIELKTSPTQAREAITELLAYGNHLQTIFPGLSASAVFYLLIAPLDNRIVKESIINMLLVQQRDIMALTPVYFNDGTVKFEPWIPNDDDLRLYSKELFNEKNFDLVKIVWEEIPEYWNPDGSESDNSHYMDIMNRVSSYCAQIMESRQISGFVYASQAPSALKNMGADLLNCLVIAGINPYRAKGERQKTLIDFIPNLSKHVDDNPDLMYDLGGLNITWSDHLMDIGHEVVEFMTTNLSGKDCQVEMTTLSWDQNFSLMEYGINLNYRVFSTGILRQLYFEYLRIDYKYMQKYGDEGHLHWNHGDVPEFIADHFDNHNFFLNFISRLHDPYREYRDLLDDVEEE